jgi:dihydropteroate synthase
MENQKSAKLWNCRGITFDLAQQGEIMGILNVTPDSFSDGGRFTGLDDAVMQAGKMVDEGAAILDIGGESTRPGADDVPVEEELARTIPVIRELAKQFPETCLSIDTSKPEVARASIEAGANVLNDVTGFRYDAMIKVAAETGVGTVAMHMLGNPRTMQEAPQYDDVVAEVRRFFEDQFEKMTSAGVDKQSIVFDSGIGFGKTLEHNLTLLNRIDELVVNDCPILLGVSRKSFIGKVIKSEAISDRSLPTVGITAFAVGKGVHLHRVHEVKENLQALRMIEAIIG